MSPYYEEEFCDAAGDRELTERFSGSEEYEEGTKAC